MAPPFIVTATLDPEVQAHLGALRAAYFPPEHNVVPAHLTLLHAVPAAQAAALWVALAAAATDTAPLPATLRGLRGLGHGVAVQIHAPGLVALHGQLQKALRPHLTDQDRQRLWPHVTVANRLDRDVARRLLAALQAGFAPRAGTITGLGVWRYVGGPWEAEGEVPFSGAPVHTGG